MDACDQEFEIHKNLIYRLLSARVNITYLFDTDQVSKKMFLFQSWTDYNPDFSVHFSPRNNQLGTFFSSLFSKS